MHHSDTAMPGPGGHTSNGPSRRTALRAVGTGLGVVAGHTALGSTTAAASPAPARAADAFAASAAEKAAESDIDFAIRFSNTQLDDQTTPPQASITVTVKNVGTADSTTDVNVVVATPFYINFDSARLPADVTYLVNNEDPAVPEMISFIVPAAELAAGQEVSRALGIVTVDNGPELFDQLDGIVLAVTDAVETELINNHAAGNVGLPTVPRVQPPDTTLVNPYFTFPQPRLTAGAPAELAVTIANASTNRATSDGKFTFVSPYNVKVRRDDEDFAARATFYHDNTDPRIPDIVSIPVSSDQLSDGATLTIPLIAQDGGHSNPVGRGYLSVGAGDFDDNLAVAISRIGVILP